MRIDKYLGVVTASWMIAGCIVLYGCNADRSSTQVSLINRLDAAPSRDPGALIVCVDPTGKLTLNRIEVGTIGDPSVLHKKLGAVLDDRRRSSIRETEILVELTGQVAFDDVSGLIESIRDLQPSRIIVTTK